LTRQTDHCDIAFRDKMEGRRQRSMKREALVDTKKPRVVP